MLLLSTVLQAPTILDLAGAPIPDDMDGLSLKESLMKGESETDEVRRMENRFTLNCML